MKTISINIILLLCLLTGYSQKIKYTYDAVGNRVSHVVTPLTPTLSVSPTTFNLPWNAGTGQIFIANLGMNDLFWTAVTNGAWVTPTPPTGGINEDTLHFSYPINNGPVRTATITISGQSGTENSPVVVQLSQEGNLAPVITTIPGQTVNSGTPFAAIPLNDYVSDDHTSDADLVWTAINSAHILASINPTTHVANLSLSDGSWSGSETITFTVTDEGGLSSSVQAIFAVESVCKPEWQLAEGFQFSMMFVCKLYFGNQLSTSPLDSLAAFINGECRGKGERDEDDPGIIYLSVGSDNLPGEIVHFKAWNSITCEESDVWEAYLFSDTLMGVPAPIVLHAGWNELNIPLASGWNWICVNVNEGSMDVNKVLEDVIVDNTCQIKSQNQFAYFNGVKWTGALKTIDPKQMYTLKVTTAQNWELVGLPSPINTINLFQNWTWVGYLPQSTFAINMALNSISPSPAVNSIIKDQYKFAKYTGTKWSGALTSLSPGKGYKIQLTQASTLLYPSPGKSGSGEGNPSAGPVPSNLPMSWNPPCDKEFNLTLLCKIKLDNETFSKNPDDIIAAFVGNECRGIATPDKENPGLYFLSINSDVPSLESIRFRYLSAAKSDIAEVTQQLRYENTEDLGTLADPFILTLASPTAIEENEIIHETFLGENYPDPFGESTTIPFGLAERGKVSLCLYDVLGREIQCLANEEMGAGSYTRKLDKGTLSKGVYLYRLTVKSGDIHFTETRRMMVE
ncbi:MAG: T9SS type A sorting domain-containing protein [Bacteroidetes bacterium]|nr:T9SS type A sorting domain-containing protein [Bacteroidota bacterium]